MPINELGRLPRLTTFEKVVWGVTLLLGTARGFYDVLAAYYLDQHGVSVFIGKPPTFDFTNLWFGGHLALQNHTADLFDLGRYRAGLEQMFSRPLSPSEWSYPPSLLLIGAALALLPLYPAYLVWTAGTLAALIVVLRRLGVPAIGCLLLAVSPGELRNVFFGHNGAATAALLMGGLLVARSRPWLAGLCFGLLTMKPQLGLLVPICLVAIGAWRTIAWSAAFAVMLVVLSAALFGLEAWTGFLQVTQPLMRSIMEAPVGQGYQANAFTLFLTARWLGADLPTAYAVQGGAALLCSVLAWRTWRSEIDIELKVATTALLSPLATPYAYSYDLVMVSAGLLVFAFRVRPQMSMTPIWLLPVNVVLLNVVVGQVAPIILAVCLGFMFGALANGRVTGTCPEKDEGGPWLGVA